MKTYDYIKRVVIMLLLTVYEGTWTILSPLIAMHRLDGSCVCIGFFFEITAFSSSGVRARSMRRCYMHE